MGAVFWPVKANAIQSTTFSLNIWSLEDGPCYTEWRKNKSLIGVKGEGTFPVHVKCLLLEHPLWLLTIVIQRECVLMTASLSELLGWKPSKKIGEGLKPGALQAGSSVLEWGGWAGRSMGWEDVLGSLFLVASATVYRRGNCDRVIDSFIHSSIKHFLTFLQLLEIYYVVYVFNKYLWINEIWGNILLFYN